MGCSPDLPSESAVELLSGVDALYRSAVGDAPICLLNDLDPFKASTADAGAPVDTMLGGYPVSVLGHGWGKYAY
ncbi:MAG: hypothetical protein RIF41_14355 [Polyangiaceae bacterium]